MKDNMVQAALLFAAPAVLYAIAATPSYAAPDASPIKPNQVQRAARLAPFQMPEGDQFDPASVSEFDRVEILTKIPAVDELGEQTEVNPEGPEGGGVGAPEVMNSEGAGGTSADDPPDSGEVEPTEPILPPGKGSASHAAQPASTKCPTNVFTGFAPSDIHGAAGPDVLAVVTNVDIGVYDKVTCQIISRVSLKTLFAGFGDISNQTLFDPRVIYDVSSGRFFMTAESRDDRGITDQYQYFAVSTTADASAWYRYRFTLSQGTSKFCKTASNSFWDYPSAGKSTNRWFITANDFQASGGATGAILAIDKAPSLTGGSVSGVCWNNLAYNLAPPIVLDSQAAQSVFLYPRPTVIGRYDHAASTPISSDVLSTRTGYSIPSWSSPPSAVQPNGQKLDSLDGRFQSASIQSRNRIWNIHAISAGSRPIVRWYRLARTSTDVLGTYTYSGSTSGTYHLFNPSFVTNSGIDGSPAYITLSRTIPSLSTGSGRASMVLGAGRNNSQSDWDFGNVQSSSSEYATDGFGSTCNSSSRGSCRWGDYSSTSVDPDGAGTAWGFNQLINGTTQFDWYTLGANKNYNIQSGPVAAAPQADGLR